MGLKRIKRLEDVISARSKTNKIDRRNYSTDRLAACGYTSTICVLC